MPDYNSDSNIPIQLRPTVDRTDLYQFQQELEQMTQRTQNSLSAMSSNILGNIRDVQGAQMMPQQGMAGGMGGQFAQMNAMNAAMYANNVNPFSPQASMAQDMFQRQFGQAGPGGMVGPGGMQNMFGGPTINPFLTTGAAPYQMATGYLGSMGSPGQPGEQVRGRLLYNAPFRPWEQGSVTNAMRTMGGMSFRGGFANDNLEDQQYRYIGRQQQYMAENISQGIRDTGTFFAGGLGGFAAGAAIGQALIPIPGVGGFIGGTVGSIAGTAALNGALDKMSGPYTAATKELRDYTTPYVRESRAGGGFNFRETMQLQRDLEKQISRDNFFTGDEYRTLIGMAGESGVFQMTSNKEQALKALENMSKSVKTLYSLGVKSREQLEAIGTSLNQFGLNPAGDPARLANVFTTMAATAQSAGMSTSQLASTSAGYGQMFAAQGLGPLTGGQIAGQNLGIAGGMFRTGGLNAFDNAYFQGAQGFAGTLTQGTAALMRTTTGQMMTTGMFAPGSNTLGNVLGGKQMGAHGLLQGVSGFASDPLGYLGMQGELPELTQGLGNIIQPAILESYVQTYRDMFGGGKIDLRKFRGFLMTVGGLPPDQALAMTKMLQNMPQMTQDMRRSAKDTQQIQHLESTRRLSMGRQFDKWKERTIDYHVVNMQTGSNEMAMNMIDSTAGTFTGLMHGTGLSGVLRDTMGINFQGGDTYEEFMTGRRSANLNGYAAYLDPTVMAQTQARAGELMKNFGYTRSVAPMTNGQRRAFSQDSEMAAKMESDPGYQAILMRTLGASGMNDKSVKNFLSSVKNQRYTAQDIDRMGNRSDLVRQMMDHEFNKARGDRWADNDGGQTFAQMREVAAQKVGTRYKDDLANNEGLYRGIASAMAATPDQLGAERSAIQTMFANGAEADSFFAGINPNDDPLAKRDAVVKRIRAKFGANLDDAGVARYLRVASEEGRSTTFRDAFGRAGMAVGAAAPPLVGVPIGMAAGALGTTVGGLADRAVNMLTGRGQIMSDIYGMMGSNSKDITSARVRGAQVLQTENEATAVALSGHMFHNQGGAVKDALSAKGDLGRANADILAGTTLAQMLQESSNIEEVKTKLRKQGMDDDEINNLFEFHQVNRVLRENQGDTKAAGRALSGLQTMAVGSLPQAEADKMRQAQTGILGHSDKAWAFKQLRDFSMRSSVAQEELDKTLSPEQMRKMSRALGGGADSQNTASKVAAGDIDTMRQVLARAQGGGKDGAGLREAMGLDVDMAKGVDALLLSAKQGATDFTGHAGTLHALGLDKDTPLNGLDPSIVNRMVGGLLKQRMGGGDGDGSAGNAYGGVNDREMLDAQDRAFKNQMALADRYDTLGRNFDASGIEKTQRAMTEVIDALGGKDTGFVKAMDTFTEAINRGFTGTIHIVDGRPVESNIKPKAK